MATTPACGAPNSPQVSCSGKVIAVAQKSPCLNTDCAADTTSSSSMSRPMPKRGCVDDRSPVVGALVRGDTL